MIGLLALLARIAAPAGTRGLEALIDSVEHHGRDGSLPPHLAFVLGIGDGVGPLPVKQAVMRDGAEVRVLNVSVARREDVVLLRTDEARHFTRAYLVSSKGALRNAVSFEAGKQPQRAPPGEAAAGVAAELSFWSNLGRPSGAAAR